MNGTFILWINQYGSIFTSTTLKELREKVGGGRVSKMYRDTAEGAIEHIGYVIGNHWLMTYKPHTF